VTSGDLWRRRSGIIVQIGAKASTDITLLTDAIVANLADLDFFIRKAIGWALREYAKTDPTWVRSFVDTHDLSPLSRREATKHL
jgi:3-methyladenine DNA glycosylase AlkD